VITLAANPHRTNEVIVSGTTTDWTLIEGSALARNSAD